MKPPIILCLGQPKNPPPNSIAIDFKNKCFWFQDNRRPSFSNRGRPPIYGYSPFRLLTILLIRSPGYVRSAEINEYLWGDDPLGGPDNTQNYVNKCIHHLRKRPSKAPPILPWLGCIIVCHSQRGVALEFNK